MSDKHIARFFDPDRSNSLTHRCRQQRNEEFKRRFPDLPDMRVLDLGGTGTSWHVAGLRAQHLTIVNIDPSEQAVEPWMEVIHGDACDGGFGKFDLVFSNSVLEHVGGHARRQQFADVVRESAPAYWVQTPYRYFPIEPHWLFPGFQFLPFRARVEVTRHWNVGHNPALKAELIFAWADESVLLRRYTETRRRHPMSPQGRVSDGVWAEQKLTAPLHSAADLVIDTSELPLASLRQLIEQRFGPEAIAFPQAGLTSSPGTPNLSSGSRASAVSVYLPPGRVPKWPPSP